MTTSQETPASKPKSATFNRWAYSLLVLLGIFFLFLKDTGTAVSIVGLALVFDPFDQQVAWSNRPRYQRAWLIVHLAVVFATFGYLIWG